MEVSPQSDTWDERVTSGGAFLFDRDETAPPIWGRDDCAIWETGESLLIYSSPGVGKTTLAGCIVRCRIGLDDRLLGMPLRAGDGRVLYLAMDRPKQAQRALARQFRLSEREVLEERLSVWRGPLTDNLSRSPQLFADLAAQFEADTLIIDSLKDTGIRLSEDEGGLAYNMARQHALAAGIELVELHHARKATSEGRKRLSIDDVYGSTWIASGSGTVLALAGDPTDTRVELSTLRAPRGDVQMQVDFDRHLGSVQRVQKLSPVNVLRNNGKTMTAKDVAAQVEGTDKPDKAAENRIRRALESAVDAGHVEKIELPRQGSAGGRPAYGYAATRGTGRSA